MDLELWTTNIVVYIYALSLLFYFSDFINENRIVKQLGTGLLVFVWTMSGLLLCHRFITELKMPVFHFSSFDVMLLFSWLLITASFIIGRFYKIELIIFFVNVIGFALFALNMYSSQREGLSLSLWNSTKGLLYLHISLVLTAYVVLTIGALLALMYLALHNRLKQKKWPQWIRRFPSLEVMERSMEKMVIIGFPLLLMSLTVAAVSVIVEGKAHLLLDIQIFMSICALLVYGYFIFERSINQRSGHYIAKLYLFAFAIQLLNLFSGGYSSFH